jgi:DAK2 domain fusion protein YloV
MARRSCDGAGLLEAFRSGVANLEAYVEEVNGLNVFPVPDGDTGSNMLATVRAALDEAERAGDVGADRVAATISHGALMGARGNSGVITSQILRGIAEDLAGKRRFNGLDLAHALRAGARTAYAAVAKPVEGTMLTVVREAAEEAVERAEQENDLEAVLAATLDAAERSVARTPSLLPILREAGVVDSGGQGLYRLFEGALLGLVAGAPAGEAGSRSGAPAKASTLAAHADEGFGYETMFLLQSPPGEMLDVDRVRLHLESIGESVLVAGDARALKVHVHNDRPDRVISFGLSLGALSHISVENLDHQARDLREERAAAFAGGGLGATGPGPEGTRSRVPAEDAQARVVVGGPASEESSDRLPLGIVAVAAGDGFHQVFEQFGIPDQLVVSIVRGGQSQNPSTGELLDAVHALPAEEALILPNNPNVVMAARQVAELADRPCLVVPTRNAAEGVAALLALDPLVDAAANVGAMTAAGRAIQSVQVTEAVRDAHFGDRKVKKGQTIALDPDDGLVAADGDRMRAILAALATFAAGYELVTIYYGDGADLDEAEAVAHRIGRAVDGAEVQLVRGGQPYYRYLISAE